MTPELDDRRDGIEAGVLRPLEGLRVLDFTRILSGPYCTLLLADLGADVIKVERRGSGDDTRSWGPPFLGDDESTSAYFAALNRSKRSVAIDFGAPGARELLRDLARRCDVVIENFRPGVAERLGLDYQSLAADNPQLVCCSISGYGRTGPYADYAGSEIVVEGMSGLMDITGPADGDPARFGIAMVDISTGLTASTRILAAVLRARTTGQGGQVQCSLYATAMAALGTSVSSYSATQVEPRRWGSHHPSLSPYGAFKTMDGHLITGILSDSRWQAFCEAIELDEVARRQEWLTNKGRVENRGEVERTVAQSVARHSTAYWLDRLHARGLLGAPVRSVGEAVDDPATRDMGLFVGLAGYPGVVSPRLDGMSTPGLTQPVPGLGEHTESVLMEVLGLEAPAIEELRRAGAI